MTTSLSAVPLPERCVVVFDLDDTLFPERDFVCSGFRAVSNLLSGHTGANHYSHLVELFDAQHADPFGQLLAECGAAIDKALLIQTYREHQPEVALSDAVVQLLDDFCATGKELGVLTDGRTTTQRNKIRALGLDRWTDAIVISEEFGSAKPAERNYRHFEQLLPGRQYVYVGDNLAKDFIAPNRLGWQTVCVLGSGQHIHSQHRTTFPKEAMPQYWIERLA